MPSVCILYGLAEGPRISKRLREALAQKGFDVIDNAKQADILIVHSGGYHLIPPNAAGKTILLAGPSNGFRGNSQFVTQLHKVLVDVGWCYKHARLGWWMYKSFWNLIYLFGEPRQHLAMLRGWRRFGKALPNFRAKRLGIVLYRGDPWSWYLDKAGLLQNQNTCLLSHPGIHDDLWMHPNEYLSVLQYLHET